MKLKRVLIAVMFLAVLLGGCNGVILNAEYSQLLDRTVALSAETAARAEAGALTEEQKTWALKAQAIIWQHFANGRDGKVAK